MARLGEGPAVSDPTYANLALPFYRQATREPERLALWVGGVEYSYGHLARRAGRIAGWLAAGGTEPVARVAILSSRTWEAYAGILGTAWAGAAYVPVSSKLPPSRIARMLEIARVDAVIVDESGLAQLSPQVLAGGPKRILAPGGRGVRLPGDVIVAGSEALPPDACAVPARRSLRDLAYIIFTSGTTGAPKGVMVSLGNVGAFLAAMQERYQMGAEDRGSQSFSLSFDGSIFDLFWTWGAGASLHVVPDGEVMAPDHFIRERTLSVWGSVPSTIAFLSRMRRLKPKVFPSLRYSWFGGEALPLSSAVAWRRAAPDSILDNFYGPTEGTAGCMGYRFSEPAVVTPERQILSIGRPFPGTTAAIVSPMLEFLSRGSVGELALSGVQLTDGYLDDPARTAARFPVIDGRRWYLTGDRAYQDASGNYHHMGRVDHQVKILGHRVELEEVEFHLREVSGGGIAAALAWPPEPAVATGLVGFVSGTALPIEGMRAAMRDRVPVYMVPSHIIVLERFPLTASGKVDRAALLRMRIEHGGGETGTPPS
jgi:D-alanine--poly(phosphoribitol) ligase subunit 1